MGGKPRALTGTRVWLRRIGVIHSSLKTRQAAPGVFATRSPDRPNPLGLHPAIVKRIAGNRLRIGPIEAIDRNAGR